MPSRPPTATIDDMNDIHDPAEARTGPASASSAPPIRRLVRSRTDRKVAGVAGGLGAYTALDPVIFRLGFVLATFFGGAGLLAYAVAWLVLPEGDTDRVQAKREQGGEDDARSLVSLIVGGFLLLLGLATLFDLAEVGFLWPASWPVAMIAAGVAVIVWARRRGGEADDGTTAPDGGAGPGRARGVEHSSGATGAPAAPGAIDVDIAPRPGSDAASTGGTDDLLPVPYGPDESGDTAVPGDEGDDGGARDDSTAPSPEQDGRPDRLRRRGISATALTVAAIFLFVGIATLGHLAEWWDLAAATVFGGALLLCGGGLIASAWLGRGLLLVPLGIVLAICLAASVWIDVPLRGGIGEHTDQPAAVDELGEPYRLAIGQLTVDLTNLDVDDAPVRRTEAAPDATIEASVGIGKLTVVVPDDVGIELEARSGIGEIVVTDHGSDLSSRSDGGMGSSVDRFLPSATDGDDVLHVSARVGIGQVEILRVPAAPDGSRTDEPSEGSTGSVPAPAGLTSTTAARSFDR